MSKQEIDWSKAPEGATHWEPESKDWREVWMRLDEGGWWFWSNFGDKWKTASGVTLERAATFVPRPSPTPWDGTGLPPVGTVCEAWHKGVPQGVVTVRYAGEFTVLWSAERGCEQCALSRNYELRPLSTPEQLAAEEREKVIREMESAVVMGCGALLSKHVYAALYDAGLRFPEVDSK